MVAECNIRLIKLQGNQSAVLYYTAKVMDLINEAIIW